MAKPWERYATQESLKPWEKYENGDQSATMKDNESDLTLSDLITGRQPEPSFTEKLGRQAGLTARIGIESLSDLGSGALGLIENAVTPATSRSVPGMQRSNPFENSGTMAADALGLPRPENTAERIVNTTGRIVTPAGGTIKAATMAEKIASSPLVQKILQSVSANPAAQLQAAGGAGASGATAREFGASPETQFAASLAGGLASPLLFGRGAVGAQAMAQPSNAAANSAETALNIDLILNKSVPNFINLSNEVQNSLRADVASALKTNGALSNEAIGRLADYRQVGAQPMRSSLTLSAPDVTRDQNLVKMSANSSDPAAQTLANVRGDNQKKIIDFINRRGAQNASTPYEAGQSVIGQLESIDQAARGKINNLYSQARDTAGRSANIDAYTFTNRANDLLDDALLGGKIPSDVRNKLNSIAQGDTPLTVDVSEQFKTNIGALQRASNDPAERLALAKVREALDEAPLLDGQGQKAIDAFNRSRNANRRYMSVVENTPALKAVRDGVQPDRFMQDYITGQKVTVKDMENLRKLVKSNPEALDTVRSQILQSLKLKGTNGAADEVATFSPHAYNKELQKIGDGKLRIFFNQEELNDLKALGRVASYEKFQPTGSAVNNSNTASTLFIGALERLGASGLLRKIPLGGVAANQINDIALGINVRNTLDPSKALKTTGPQVRTEVPPEGYKFNAAGQLEPFYSNNPRIGAAAGVGLLSAPTD